MLVLCSFLCLRCLALFHTPTSFTATVRPAGLGGPVDWSLECTCLALIHPSLFFSPHLTSVFVMAKPGSNNTRGRLAPSWFSGNETSSTQSPGLPFFALALTSFIPVRPRDSQLWCCGTCPHCFQRILSAGKLYGPRSCFLAMGAVLWCPPSLYHVPGV